MTRRELIAYYQTKLENPKLSPQSRKIAMATWGELKYTEVLERAHRALRARVEEDRHTRPQRPPGPLEPDLASGSGRAPREEDNPGHEGSKGFTMEIAHTNAHGIPVIYLEAADE